QMLTPSAVSVDKGTIMVGLAARERQATHARDTVTAFKRYMGTARSTFLGGKRFSPEELSALVLRSLREDAETYFGESVSEAVITVPAYFNDKQRKATRRAGELAGLKVERLVNEPTAAALAYGIHHLDADSRFLVFDLGGGTFDVSVLEIFEGIVEVRASTGDTRLGGEDFNELMITLACEKLGQGWAGKVKMDIGLQQKLREQAERARRTLSNAEAATMKLIWKDEQLEVSIAATEFEARAEGLISRLRDPVLRSLRDSGLHTESLSEIILIGGATRMPIVRKAVARMFGRFPNTNINPDQAVALGAAVQAGLKARDSALREVVLTDVCPFSLGVSNAERLPDGSFQEGVFSPIIERNTAIPASRMRSYFTLDNNQTTVRLDIYQGESRLVADNVKIADLLIPVPRNPAGTQVDCRFSYDINGLLEVDVHVPSSGESFELVISDPDENGSAIDLQQRREELAKLKIHPRDTEANRAVMARAERCWQDSLAETREMIGHWINQFNAALATQNPKIVDRAREEFSSALDRIDGQSFL
ncbi:Hsp70 family protein, partial [Rhizorhabdus sp. FW153]|uniref:Hsp70 family protein n=1 Tax=Rhizorhabdus sp. FW153 TaxID=3400216 RepID=UPI003CFA6319